MKKVLFFFGIVLTVLLSVSSCKKEESDPCDNVTCENGGTCNNGSCQCAAGYEGATCATQQRAKFFGTYLTNGCDESFTLSVTSSAAGVSNVLLNFPSDFGIPPMSATISGNTLTIPLQNIIDADGFAVTFSGSGSLSGNVLSWTLTAVYDGFGDSCAYISVKQ